MINPTLKKIREHNLVEKLITFYSTFTLCGYDKIVQKVMLKDFHSKIDFLYENNSILPEEANKTPIRVIGTTKGLIRWNHGGKQKAEKNLATYLIASGQYFHIDLIADDIENCIRIS